LDAIIPTFHRTDGQFNHPSFIVVGSVVWVNRGFSAAIGCLEYADERSRGFYASWQPFSRGPAAVIAALVGLAISNLLRRQPH
jgi:hypothetical protein